MVGKRLGGYRVYSAAKIFPMMSGPALDAFCQDIKRRGLLEPIVLWQKGASTFVLDGRNRLHACEKEGVEPRFTYYKGDDPTAYVISHNLHRRHLTESQRAMVGARLVEVLRKEGEVSRGRPKKNVVDPPQNEKDEGRKPAVRDQAALLVNVGGSAVQKALKVIEHGDDDLVTVVDGGRIKVELGAQIADKPKDEQKAIVRKVLDAPRKNPKAIVRQHDLDAVRKKIEAEPPPLPDGPFKVVAADPNWQYDRSDDPTHRGTTPYPTDMPLPELQAFVADAIAQVADDDCVLWLWITKDFLLEGAHIPILKKAGFVGKNIWPWDKLDMGVGNYGRNRYEYCILAVKGSPTLDMAGEPNAFVEKIREHSRKPECFYELVSRACPGSKVELFSQTDREGWTAWGAEAGKYEGELAS